MTPKIFVKLSLKSSKKAKLGPLKYQTERKSVESYWLGACEDSRATEIFSNRYSVRQENNRASQDNLTTTYQFICESAMRVNIFPISK